MIKCNYEIALCRIEYMGKREMLITSIFSYLSCFVFLSCLHHTKTKSYREDNFLSKKPMKKHMEMYLMQMENLQNTENDNAI